MDEPILFIAHQMAWDVLIDRMPRKPQPRVEWWHPVHLAAGCIAASKAVAAMREQAVI